MRGITRGWIILNRSSDAADWVADRLISRFVLVPATGYLVAATTGHAPFHPREFVSYGGIVLLIAAYHRYSRREKRREQEYLDKLDDLRVKRAQEAAQTETPWPPEWEDLDPATAQDAAEAERRYREFERRDRGDA